MRNLLLFFSRFAHFFLFLFLEIICFSIIVSVHRYHNSTFVSSANKVSGRLFEISSGVGEYFYLKSVNDSLRKEIAQLKTNLPERYYSLSLQRGEVIDDSCKVVYTYQPARVLNNSVDRSTNYLTIDKGTLHGVKKEMGVIGPNGVVGVVRNVSEHYATVMSLLHKDSRLSARINSSDYVGNLEWDGPSPLMAELKGIPLHVVLNKGDSVITSGYSAIFPPDIMIGHVEEVNKPSGANFYEVEVRLTTSFASLRYVYVVEYLMYEELKRIQQSND